MILEKVDQEGNSKARIRKLILRKNLWEFYRRVKF